MNTHGYGMRDNGLKRKKILVYLDSNPRLLHQKIAYITVHNTC